LEVGRRMVQKVIQGILDLGVVEMSPNVEGKGMLAVVAPSAATIAAASNRDVQARIEAEREEDIAAGFVEEEEDDDDASDTDDDGPVAVAEAPKLTPEEVAAAKKAANRIKRAQKLADEQLGLP
jgi:hypothetical protein